MKRLHSSALCYVSPFKKKRRKVGQEKAPTVNTTNRQVTVQWHSKWLYSKSQLLVTQQTKKECLCAVDCECTCCPLRVYDPWTWPGKPAPIQSTVPPTSWNNQGSNPILAFLPPPPPPPPLRPPREAQSCGKGESWKGVGVVGERKGGEGRGEKGGYPRLTPSTCHLHTTVFQFSRWKGASFAGCARGFHRLTVTASQSANKDSRVPRTALASSRCLHQRSEGKSLVWRRLHINLHVRHTNCPAPLQSAYELLPSTPPPPPCTAASADVRQHDPTQSMC